MHLLIPFAWPLACESDPAAQAVSQALQLPNLQALLQSLQTQAVQREPEDSPLLPHERVLGQSLGLLGPDADADQIPWAAWEAQQVGRDANGAWAFISPCHWQVAQSQITLSPQPVLDLRPEESDALLTAMQPYFKEDGIDLQSFRPEQWLARSELFEGVSTASPQRLAGQDIAGWLPESPVLRRLQNEMQMLLYTHPVNDARSARGALPVNSFWISGCGALPAEIAADARPPIVVTTLMDAALCADWSAWAQAWQALDATALADLRQALASNETDASLTLCSERSRITLQGPRRRSWLARLGLSGPIPLTHLWSQL